MKRRLFTGFTAAMLLLTLMLPLVTAADTDETTEETTQETVEETTEETKSKYSMETSGTCGKDLRWYLEDHTLVITGSGKMDAGSPWGFYKDVIHTVILDGEITTVGDEAFSACNNLRYVDFGDALVEIGYQAFYSCNALEAIRLPASFRKFGPECFRDCESLEIVFCEGPMPSFKASCLYNEHTVVIYYTHAMPWPQEEVDRLLSNFGWRLSVNVGTEEVLEDYLSDMPTAVPTEPAPTEPETEPTVPETTVPPTTEPPQTQPPTVPETAATEPSAPAEPAVEAEEAEPVFELEAEPLYVTEPEPTPPIMEKLAGTVNWTWVIIAAAVVTGIVILALLIRMISHGGGRYSD